ncbi:hypothetical protein PYCC9005_001011 [Savitreella phatthalungensis]
MSLVETRRATRSLRPSGASIHDGVNTAKSRDSSTTPSRVVRSSRNAQSLRDTRSKSPASTIGDDDFTAHTPSGRTSKKMRGDSPSSIRSTSPLSLKRKRATQTSRGADTESVTSSISASHGKRSSPTMLRMVELGERYRKVASALVECEIAHIDRTLGQIRKSQCEPLNAVFARFDETRQATIRRAELRLSLRETQIDEEWRAAKLSAHSQFVKDRGELKAQMRQEISDRIFTTSREHRDMAFEEMGVASYVPQFKISRAPLALAGCTAEERTEDLVRMGVVQPSQVSLPQQSTTQRIHDRPVATPPASNLSALADASADRPKAAPTPKKRKRKSKATSNAATASDSVELDPAKQVELAKSATYAQLSSTPAKAHLPGQSSFEQTPQSMPVQPAHAAQPGAQYDQSWPRYNANMPPPSGQFGTQVGGPLLPPLGPPRYGTTFGHYPAHAAGSQPIAAKHDAPPQLQQSHPAHSYAHQQHYQQHNQFLHGGHQPPPGAYSQPPNAPGYAAPGPQYGTPVWSGQPYSQTPSSSVYGGPMAPAPTREFQGHEHAQPPVGPPGSGAQGPHSNSTTGKTTPASDTSASARRRSTSKKDDADERKTKAASLLQPFKGSAPTGGSASKGHKRDNSNHSTKHEHAIDRLPGERRAQTSAECSRTTPPAPALGAAKRSSQQPPSPIVPPPPQYGVFGVPNGPPTGIFDAPAGQAFQRPPPGQYPTGSTAYPPYNQAPGPPPTSDSAMHNHTNYAAPESNHQPQPSQQQQQPGASDGYRPTMYGNAPPYGYNVMHQHPQHQQQQPAPPQAHAYNGPNPSSGHYGQYGPPPPNSQMNVFPGYAPRPPPPPPAFQQPPPQNSHEGPPPLHSQQGQSLRYPPNPYNNHAMPPLQPHPSTDKSQLDDSTEHSSRKWSATLPAMLPAPSAPSASETKRNSRKKSASPATSGPIRAKH